MFKTAVAVAFLLGAPICAQAGTLTIFASGGVQDVALAGLHIGHLGEGHCHVSAQ